MVFRLRYAAISDVGRVRKDNQDSGYAGPWLLAVCDGVGGAARGDLASATAIGQLRKIDAKPNTTASDDMRGQVAGALHRANDRIAELVDDDPSLSGTSTTATLALFDGSEADLRPRRRQPRVPLPRRARSARSPRTTRSCRASSTRAGSPRRTPAPTRTAT